MYKTIVTSPSGEKFWAYRVSWKEVVEACGTSRAAMKNDAFDEYDYNKVVEWLISHGAESWVRAAHGGIVDDQGWTFVGPKVQ